VAARVETPIHRPSSSRDTRPLANISLRLANISRRRGSTRRPRGSTRRHTWIRPRRSVVAGLLQLLGLFGLVGVGRIYLGYTGLGIAQLLVGLVTCGIGAVVWGIIDAVLILTDKVRDPEGRPLRDGT
jgi:TM2 domain-containing membrane protein YozV